MITLDPGYGRFNIGVVIPTYNEYHNLITLLPTLKNLDLDNVYVVDDDSQDGTCDLVSRFPEVKFVIRKNQRGLVSAEIEGMRHAENDFLVVMAADFSHDPSTIVHMVEYAIRSKADVVVGSRYIENGNNGDRFSRKVISYVANKLVNLSFHPAVKDATSGFRVYSKRAYKFLSEEEKIKPGYTGQVDILERLITAGFMCSEYPIAFISRKNGRSKLKFRDIIDFFAFVAFRGNLLKYAIVGTTGILVNELVLYLLHGFHPILADLVAIEISITTNFFLNDLWTFKNRKKRFGFVKRIALHNIFSILPGAVNFIFYFSLYLKGFEYLDANLLGIAAAYVVRYILSSSIVWGENKTKAKYPENE